MTHSSDPGIPASDAGGPFEPLGSDAPFGSTDSERFVITVATEVVKETGWPMIPIVGQRGVALLGPSRLLVLLPAEVALTSLEVDRDLVTWHRIAQGKGPPKTPSITLLYVSSAPVSAAFDGYRKKRKVNFLGGAGVTVDFLEVGRGKGKIAQLDGTLTSAVNKGVALFSGGVVATPEELYAEGARSHEAHNKLAERMEETRPLGTYAILGLCLLMFAGVTAVGGSSDLVVLLRCGANFPPLTMDQGQWWRLVGAMFLHGGAVHLGVNMLTLWSVGARVEKMYGNAAFLALYAVSGVCGSLASVLTGESVSVGASGALFGLLGAIVVAGHRYRSEWPARFRSGLLQGMLPMIALNLIYGFSNAGIDNAAHLGGLFGGSMFALLVPPRVLGRPVAVTLTRVLMAIGLLPFLVQGMSLHSAFTVRDLSGFPQKTFTSTTGQMQWSMPAFFRWEAKDGEQFLLGPALAVTAGQLDGLDGLPVDDPALAKNLAESEGSRGTEVVTIAGKTWLLHDAVANGAAVRQAFGYVGKTVMKIEVDAAQDSASTADALRRQILETLQPIDGNPETGR